MAFIPTNNPRQHEVSVDIKIDPFITRMAHHSVAMPDFRTQMAAMMKDSSAFVIRSEKTCVTIHPSDALLDAFYCAMGCE